MGATYFINRILLRKVLGRLLVVSSFVWTINKKRINSYIKKKWRITKITGTMKNREQVQASSLVQVSEKMWDCPQLFTKRCHKNDNRHLFTLRHLIWSKHPIACCLLADQIKSNTPWWAPWYLYSGQVLYLSHYVVLAKWLQLCLKNCKGWYELSVGRFSLVKSSLKTLKLTNKSWKGIYL